jgi:hypothetical protein
MRILSPWPEDLECAGHWNRSDRSARALRLPLIMTPKLPYMLNLRSHSTQAYEMRPAHPYDRRTSAIDRSPCAL